jgi:hypothetical protein
MIKELKLENKMLNRHKKLMLNEYIDYSSESLIKYLRRWSGRTKSIRGKVVDIMFDSKYINGHFVEGWRYKLEMRGGKYYIWTKFFRAKRV